MRRQFVERDAVPCVGCRSHINAEMHLIRLRNHGNWSEYILSRAYAAVQTSPRPTSRTTSQQRHFGTDKGLHDRIIRIQIDVFLRWVDNDCRVKHNTYSVVANQRQQRLCCFFAFQVYGNKFSDAEKGAIMIRVMPQGSICGNTCKNGPCVITG